MKQASSRVLMIPKFLFTFLLFTTVLALVTTGCNSKKKAAEDPQIKVSLDDSLVGDDDDDNDDNNDAVGVPEVIIPYLEPDLHSKNLVSILPGAGIDDNYGASVAALGDMNGDDIPDFIVGAPDFDSQTLCPSNPLLCNSSGAAYILSGADFIPIYGDTVLFGRANDGSAVHAGQKYGQTVVAVGDVDGDDTNDFAVGAPGDFFSDVSGYVEVYSGVDASLIHRIQGNPQARFGKSIVNAGDVNGDGHDDLVIGSPSANNGSLLTAGSIGIFSGADGNLMPNGDLVSNDESNYFGRHLAALGDVDGDGFGEIAVSSKLSICVLSMNPAYLGGDKIIYCVDAATAGLPKLDFKLVGLGDMDGDGISEFAIGASHVDRNGNMSTSAEGHVVIVSGANGFVIRHLVGGLIRRELSETSYVTAGQFLGTQVGYVGDVNGDGLADIMIGTDDERIQFHSGAAIVSGSMVTQLSEIGSDTSCQLLSVTLLGDLTSDGTPDVATGHHCGTEDAGKLKIYDLPLE